MLRHALGDREARYAGGVSGSTQPRFSSIPSIEQLRTNPTIGVKSSLRGCASSHRVKLQR